MKNFENFEIENQEMIYGGRLITTSYEGRDGSSGGDLYDTKYERLIYPE